MAFNLADLPSMWDGSKFVGLSEAVLDHLPDHVCAAYELVRDCADELESTEDRIKQIEADVRDRTRQLREIEAAIAKLPRLTHVDLCRQVFASNRAARGL